MHPADAQIRRLLLVSLLPHPTPSAPPNPGRKESIQGFFGNDSILTNASAVVEGYESLNEAFYDEITPLTSGKAYMVAVGNHESVSAAERPRRRSRWLRLELRQRRCHRQGKQHQVHHEHLHVRRARRLANLTDGRPGQTNFTAYA